MSNFVPSDRMRNRHTDDDEADNTSVGNPYLSPQSSEPYEKERESIFSWARQRQSRMSRRSSICILLGLSVCVLGLSLAGLTKLLISAGADESVVWAVSVFGNAFLAIGVVLIILSQVLGLVSRF